MTKEQRIELVQNYLGGGSAPTDIKKRYRKGIISLYIGMVFNEALAKIAMVDIDSLNSYTKVYGTCAITTDSTLNLKYIEIPTTSADKLLQIPNNRAIREVYLNGTGTTKYKCTYRNMGANEVYSGLEVNTYIDIPRYDILGERIYFSSHITGTTYTSLTTATVKMVVPWSEYSSSEDVPMPFETNDELFMAVIAKLRQEPPQDKIIDQNAVQPEIK